MLDRGLGPSRVNRHSKSQQRYDAGEPSGVFCAAGDSSVFNLGGFGSGFTLAGDQRCGALLVEPFLQDFAADALFNATMGESVFDFGKPLVVQLPAHALSQHLASGDFASASGGVVHPNILLATNEESIACATCGRVLCGHNDREWSGRA